MTFRADPRTLCSMSDGGGSGERRLGVGFGIAAYGMWGLFPLYWPLLKPAQAGEILATRMAWSLLAVLIILAVRPVPGGAARWSWVRPLVRSPRQMLLLTVAACVISVN